MFDWINDSRTNAVVDLLIDVYESLDIEPHTPARVRLKSEIRKTLGFVLHLSPETTIKMLTVGLDKEDVA